MTIKCNGVIIKQKKRNLVKTKEICLKCSLGISNFLEEISSLSHSVVFLYFFALIAEEGEMQIKPECDTTAHPLE